MTVEFDEIQGSPKFTYGPDGFVAIREGYTAYGDIDTFISETLLPVSATGLQGAPAAFPTNDNLRVSTFEIEPELTSSLGPNANKDFDTLVTYQRAKFTIRYTTVRGQMPNLQAEAIEEGDPVPFLSHRWSIGGEFLTIPTLDLEWAVDNAAVEEDVNAGILIPTIEHQITWERVRTPPFDAIRGLIGHVNSSRVTFATGVIYTETLLFVGAELERQIMSDGARAWKVMYRFSERVVDAVDSGSDSIEVTLLGVTITRTLGGWNHFYRPGDGFSRLQTTTPRAIYTRSNLSPLFTLL